ncbi:MAG: hypothetical protein WC758_03130 [Candidatus Woesearchaeota archaeon]
MKKGGHILIFLLVLFISSISVLALGDDCCVDVTGKCTSDLEIQCMLVSGTYYPQNCNSLPECVEVCCELADACEFVSNATCTNSDGIIRSEYTTAAMCSQYCESGTTLQGQINYSNNLPGANAKITITNTLTDDFILATANSLGQFSVIVNENSNYEIVAVSENDETCTISTTKEVGSKVDGPYNVSPLILPCTPNEPDCITVWITGPWSDLENNCGTRTVTDTGNCIPSTLNNKPVDYLLCGADAVCGNGVLEEGEDCDPSMIPQIPTTGDECSELVGNSETSQGTVTCSNQCQIISSCIDCPTTIKECTNSVMCDICPICVDSTICQKQCNPEIDVVFPFDALGGYNEDSLRKEISLSWGLPDWCKFSSIELFRCKGNDALNPTTCAASARFFSVANLGGGETEWIDDSNLLQNGINLSFCYNISVTGMNGPDTFVIGSNALACAAVWDDECLEKPDGTSCNGQELITCAKGKVTSKEECSCACKEESIQAVASCINVDSQDSSSCSICDICSGPFGLVPYINYDINTIYTQYTSCNDVLAKVDSEGGYCYVDDYSKNNAIIGNYKMCAGLNSCYDYRTEFSCENNPCQLKKIEDIGGCKWNSFTSGSDELGLGVCMPIDVEKQECSECNTNNMLGNYCPLEICSLFGQDENNVSTCFYNELKIDDYKKLKIDNTTCMNKRDVACETYDSQDLCLGGNANSATENSGDMGTRQGITPETIDVFGSSFSSNTIYFDDERIGNNHEYITLSKDLLNRTKCVWLQEKNKCVRDADYSTGITNNDSNSDCGHNQDESCFLDFINPETKLFILNNEFLNNGSYSKGELRTLAIQTSEDAETFLSIARGTVTESNDDSNSGSEIAMGAGDSGNGNPINDPPVNSEIVINYPFVYPTMDLEEFNLSLANTLSSGNYRLYFYSQDASQNLEFVKYYDFTLLNGLGNIKVNYTLNSEYYSSPDMYLTNLTVAVIYNDDLICRVNLSDVFNSTKTFLGDAIKSSPNLIWNYDYLIDGVYSLSTYCVDNHLQSFENITIIVIDADKSLHNATPRGQTFREGNVNISINTIANATCYYTNNISDGIPGEIDAPIDEVPPNDILPPVDVDVPGDEMPVETSMGDSGNDPVSPPITTQSWIEYDDTGNLYHKAELTEINSGVKYYYTACKFDDDSWHMWNNGDVIYYVIDELSPQIEIIDLETAQTYNSSVVVEEVSLQITCNDNSEILNVGTINYAFGCANEINVNEYYVNYSNNAIIEVFDTQVLTPTNNIVNVNIPNYYAKVYLNITAVDLGGNKNNTKIFVNVRNLSFLDPIVIICNLETGLCD